MASSKRDWQGHIVNRPTQAPSSSSSAMATDSNHSFVQSMFETFRSELDEHHDRREKIIKASRDITALSKKIIFALQRLREINAPIPPNIAKENKTRFDQIHHLFKTISVELTGSNSWRYQRQVSGGLQEFIEALSFQHYIQTQRLITIEEVAAYLPASDENEHHERRIIVTEEDYLMGIYDLTGEMMRFAVTTLSTGGQIKKSGLKEGKNDDNNDDAKVDDLGAGQASQFPILPAKKADILNDLRYMRSMLEELNVPRRHSSHMMRDMYKKMEVMQNSVEKVERAAYGLLVRGSERPSGWTPDLSNIGAGGGAGAASVEVESY